jgi:hypothetical protein
VAYLVGAHLEDIPERFIRAAVGVREADDRARLGVGDRQWGEVSSPPLTAYPGSTDALLQDPVPQVSGVGGLEHLGPLQLERTAEVLE